MLASETSWSPLFSKSSWKAVTARPRLVWAILLDWLVAVVREAAPGHGPLLVASTTNPRLPPDSPSAALSSASAYPPDPWTCSRSPHLLVAAPMLTHAPFSFGFRGSWWNFYASLAHPRTLTFSFNSWEILFGKGSTQSGSILWGLRVTWREWGR